MTIYEAIGNIAADLSVNYVYGSIKDVQKQIRMQMKDDKIDIYPIVILLTPPIPETSSPGAMEIKTYTGVELILATETQKDYTTPQRVTNVYTPTLWPLRDNFLKYLKTSEDITIDGTIEDVDEFHYSATAAKEQNALAAVLDAITIKANLKIIKTC